MSRYRDIKTWKFYRLFDGRLPNQTMYVGVTGRTLNERLKQHLTCQKNIYKFMFIQSLLEYGILPKIELIEEFRGSWLQVKIRESAWIKYYLEQSMPLTNIQECHGVNVESFLFNMYYSAIKHSYVNTLTKIE